MWGKKIQMKTFYITQCWKTLRFEDVLTLFSHVQPLFILCREMNYSSLVFIAKKKICSSLFLSLFVVWSLFCTINTLFSLQKECSFFTYYTNIYGASDKLGKTSRGLWLTSMGNSFVFINLFNVFFLNKNTTVHCLLISCPLNNVNKYNF